MESNCAWLERRLGLDETQLARVVVASPPLLYFERRRQPGAEARLLATGDRPLFIELRDHVLRIPAIPSYSLERRYRPRVEACLAAGVDPAYVLTSAPYTDEKSSTRASAEEGPARWRGYMNSSHAIDAALLDDRRANGL